MDNLQRMYNTLDVVIPLTKERKFQFSANLDSSYLNIIYGDDLEYAKEIFELFLQDTGKEMSKLVASMQASSHSTVYQIAHRIKPTLAMVGLTNASKIVQAIEERAIEGQAEYNDLIGEVEAIQNNRIPIVKQELTRIQQQLKKKLTG